MKTLAKTLFLCLFFITFFNLSFGQETSASKEEKQKESQNEINIPKILARNRKISKYLNGGSISCGYVSPPYKCDFNKLRSFIWENWTKKKLAYFSWFVCGRDYCYWEHYFIEPDKKGNWVIVSYGDHTQNEKIEERKKIYRIKWGKNEDEDILIFKDKKGKVIEKF